MNANPLKPPPTYVKVSVPPVFVPFAAKPIPAVKVVAPAAIAPDVGYKNISQSVSTGQFNAAANAS